MNAVVCPPYQHPTHPPHPTPTPPAGNHAFETFAAAVSRGIPGPKVQAALWLQAENSRRGYAHHQAQMVSERPRPCPRTCAAAVAWPATDCQRAHSAWWTVDATACPRCVCPAPALRSSCCCCASCCSMCGGPGSTWLATPSCGATLRLCCPTTAPTSVTRVGGAVLPAAAAAATASCVCLHCCQGGVLLGWVRRWPRKAFLSTSLSAAALLLLLLLLLLPLLLTDSFPRRRPPAPVGGAPAPEPS